MAGFSVEPVFDLAILSLGNDKLDGCLFECARTHPTRNSHMGKTESQYGLQGQTLALFVVSFLMSDRLVLAGHNRMD
jgi:hypothetical protein